MMRGLRLPSFVIPSELMICLGERQWAMTACTLEFLMTVAWFSRTQLGEQLFPT